MKRFLFLCAAILSISIAKAQFSPFKVDLAVGGAFPQGAGAKGGVSFSLEPKYAVISRLSVGLRLEAAVMARGYVSSDGSTVNASVSAAASYLATADWYFSNSTFRPFSGLGTGLYNCASASANSAGAGAESAGASTHFGTMVRTGFEISHFRLAIEYNIVGKTNQSGVDGSGNKYTVSSNNNYMGIKIGFFIGGGRRGNASAVPNVKL